MRNRIFKISQAAIAGLGLALSGGAFAQIQADNAYTPAGTDINNIATVNYTLGGVAQEEIESDPNGNATIFDVDRIIDLDVFTDDVELVNAGYDPTGQAIADIQYYLTYEVKNLGNDVQDLLLTVLNNADGLVEDVDNDTNNESADEFDGAAFRIFEDTNGNDTLDAGDTELTFLDEVAPDESRTVFVASSVPLVDSGGNALVDGNAGYITLAAQAADGGGAGAEGAVTTEDNGAESDAGDGSGTGYAGGAGADADGIQTVFGDAPDTNDNGDGDLVAAGVEDNNGDANGTVGNEDGRAADTAVLEIAQLLSVQKVSTVISDPFNGNTNPKRIPGAVIQYTITVTNQSTITTAENVAVTDDVPANVTYVTASVAGDVDGTDEGYTDAANFTAGAGANGNGQINTTATNLAPGEVLTVTFQITID